MAAKRPRKAPPGAPKYHRLTVEKRIIIQTLRKEGRSRRYIAESPDAAMERVRDARVRASYCNATDSVRAVWDGVLPKSSDDLEPPRLTFWDHLGTEEWVHVKFDAPRTMRCVEVYWFDDYATRKAGCALPETWAVQFRGDAASPWRDMVVAGVTLPERPDLVKYAP